MFIWKSKIFFLKSTVMRSYSVLAINAYMTEDNFHYKECGIAKLLQVRGTSESMTVPT